ncbi:DUF167 domain-containing protein [Hymenobacter psychrophilus]|uniref:UPF0235 protein SAMN04488069_10324 n=1 Tax=Hymenobacter psychrophilus TaxID=651662 RepID=A0A1H3EAT3_9BACT|nr:DUF167 domain-containing protein [Hymenobacter psychrophilus]SDX74999.1 hypothetical protein SAMN04488069_10324 [Hymenobacter psychrophilus]
MPVLHLKARPNARHNQLAVAPDGTVTVRLHAPAQDGKANACLLAYLAEVFSVSKSSLTLLSGHAAPFKKVEIGGLSEAEFQQALGKFRSQ